MLGGAGVQQEVELLLKELEGTTIINQQTKKEQLIPPSEDIIKENPEDLTVCGTTFSVTFKSLTEYELFLETY